MDKHEFSERVRKCQGKLWRISYLILRNEYDCDDAVQEALIRAWKHRGKLKNTEYFETWLIRILINTSKTLTKKRKNDVDIESVQMGREMECNNIRKEIGKLDLKYRIPMTLHYIEGYSVEETGKMLNLPVTTIKWRLYTARKMLKEALEV